MTTTGTFLFDPEFESLLSEAFERAGVDPADMTTRHTLSAARSAQLMTADWLTRGVKQWTLVKYTLPFVEGQVSYVLPAGAWGIFHATIKNVQGTEREMYPISRSDYNAIHDKTIPGEPDRYFVDSSTFIGADPASTIFVWQSPNAQAGNGFTMEMYYIRRIEDVGDPTFNRTLDIPFHWTEAFASGLAYYLSKKFAIDRVPMLLADYLGEDPKKRDSHMPGGALGRAIDADREKAPAVFRPKFDRRYGRRG